MYYIYDSINNYNNNDYKSFSDRLNTLDKIKIDKLINTSDKKLTILSRILLNKLLNKYYNTSYFDINIKYNKYNKPYTDNICFNISHSNDYACAVVSNKNVSIDIELIRNNTDIINYVCTDREFDYINKSINKYKSLFTIFCLKEAYFKMIGTGIDNLKDIEFTFNNKDIICNKGNFNIIIDYSIDNYVICIIEE